MAQRLLRRPIVEDLTGLSRSSIYQKIRKAEFPRPVKIGCRAVAWKSSDIEDWLNSRPIISESSDA